MASVNKIVLRKRVRSLLEEANAENVVEIDVRTAGTVFDTMFIATGKARRHNKAIIERVVESLKIAGVKPLGIEGESEAEWILLDYGDVVIHVMRQSCRDFYALEKLWGTEVTGAGEN